MRYALRSVAWPGLVMVGALLGPAASESQAQLLRRAARPARSFAPAPTSVSPPVYYYYAPAPAAPSAAPAPSGATAGPRRGREPHSWSTDAENTHAYKS